MNLPEDPQYLLDNLRQACPNLDIVSARPISGHGQNNAILIVNESIVFRFPRYDQGLTSLEHELAILQGIRPFLTLAVPEPRYVSLGDPIVGRVFLGYPMIPGVPLGRATLEAIQDDRILRSLGGQAGGFLKELHAILIGGILPDEAARFDPIAMWQDLYLRIRDRLYSHMRPDARSTTTDHFESFFDRAKNWSISPVLIHGDFGTGNVLADPDTWKITGVIDFSSAGAGDPAIDYAAVSGTPRPFYDGLVEAYPEVASATDRVRFYRGTFALQEALFGIETGDDQAFRAGIAAYR